MICCSKCRHSATLFFALVVDQSTIAGPLMLRLTWRRPWVRPLRSPVLTVRKMTDRGLTALWLTASFAAAVPTVTTIRRERAALFALKVSQ